MTDNIKDNLIDIEADKEIYDVGGFILKTELFEAARHQIHHKRTTVARHIMSVTRKAVKLCDILEKHGKNVDRKCVILGALCHDLGIIGRDQKYANDFECWLRHPKDSVTEAKKLIPDMSRKLERVILNHMWPLSGRLPHSAEERIVIAADKAATFTDLIE